MNVAPVDYLRALPREEQVRLLRSLPRGALAAVATDPRFWARPEQALPDPGELARIELATGGRRAGKSQWACWLFSREWTSGRAQAPRVVASTKAAVYDTLITGPAGLWTWLPHKLKARVGFDVSRAWTTSREHAGVFEIPGLPPVVCLSAEKPGSATGQGKDLTWADDPAAWVKVCGERKAREMFYELRVSTSEGARPCVIVSTTTGGVQFLRRALSGNMAGVSRRHLGSAQDNTALSLTFRRDVLGDMIGEGDDSDLTGIETTRTKGALWQPEWISAHRIAAAPELARVVVAIDPADSGDASADAVGIVVVGLGVDGRLYVLADYSAQWEAPQWAAIAAWAFRKYKCDAIVCEMNRSESAVRACLAVESPNVPIVGVDATRDKATRAGPCAMLHRDGQVSHLADGPQLHRPGCVWIKVPIYNPATGQRDEVELEVKRDPRSWQTLEDELCGWVPGTTRRSPGGLDALVWACWYLRPPEAVEETEQILSVPGRYAEQAPRFAPPGGGRYAGAYGRRGR